jgi:rhamnose transport system permease protein
MKRLSYTRPFRAANYFLRWEWILVLLVLLISLLNSRLSPFFLNLSNLFDMTFNFMERGFISLIMTFVIISGNMDFSVASTLALASCVMGKLFQAGLNIWLAAAVALAIGLAAGFLNGTLVTRLSIPSFAATLGTYAFYRGIAWVILENTAIAGFPASFNAIGQGDMPGTEFPIPLFTYLLLLIPAALFLHRSTFGRYTFAIGGSREVSRFSGIRTDQVVRLLFMISGLVSALSGVFMAARYGSVRADIAPDATLDVVTVVVLGGVSIMGGTGSITGVVLSLFLLGIVRYGMNLINIPPQEQIVITGLLLIVSVFIPQLINRLTMRKEVKPREEKGPNPP